MEEEWISLNEFMRRKNIGHDVALQMIYNGDVEGKKYGSRWKIKVGGDTVSRQLYEEEHRKRIEAETTLKLLQNILFERK